MSTIKKLLALVLALTMALSISAAAAYSVVPYGDAAGIDAGAAEAVEMLYNMGIMKGDDKGNFNPNATITRAEVAKMIYVVLNYGKDDKAVNANRQYDDFASDNKATLGSIPPATADNQQAAQPAPVWHRCTQNRPLPRRKPEALSRLPK